jgi:hypothetical protein
VLVLLFKFSMGAHEHIRRMYPPSSWVSWRLARGLLFVFVAVAALEVLPG